jgi:hypothetical protein
MAELTSTALALEYFATTVAWEDGSYCSLMEEPLI